jgi:acyl carrier protein
MCENGEPARQAAERAIRAALAQRAEMGAVAMRVGTGDNLFSHGLTSLGCVRVMLAVEAELAIEFPGELIRTELFATIDSLATACTAIMAAAGSARVGEGE